MGSKGFQWGYIPIGIMGIAIGLIIGLIITQFGYAVALLVVTTFALGILVGGFIPEIYRVMITPLKGFQWGYIPIGIMGIAIGLLIGLFLSQFAYSKALVIVTIFAFGILVGGFIPEIYGMMIAPLQEKQGK